MKKTKVLYLMKYISIVNVFGILLMLTLRLDYVKSPEEMDWTPLYIPFCYQIEPVFGLWTSYLVMIVPVMVMIALWRNGIKDRLFLQAMFRVEIYKNIAVIIVRIFHCLFLRDWFVEMDYIWVGVALLTIFLLRKGMRELRKDEELRKYNIWEVVVFICLAIVVPLIPMIQYNEGIPATNSRICMRIKLDKPGIIAETKFRVVRYSPRGLRISFNITDLQAVDQARFIKQVTGGSGIDMSLLLHIYREEGGKETLVYSDKIDQHNDPKWFYDIDFKKPNLPQGTYRAELECIKPSAEYEGVEVNFFINKNNNDWKIFTDRNRGK